MSNLVEFLRGVSKEIYSLQTEIGCVNSSSYETQMMTTWKDLVAKYHSELEAQKATLMAECRAKHEEISARLQLIGETANLSHDKLEPPYKQRLAEAEQELASVNARLASRESAKAKISKNIDELSREMQVDPPLLPDLLTDAAMNDCRNIETKLAEERTRRIEQVREYLDKIGHWQKYLGIDTSSTLPNGIDSKSIEDLKHICADLNSEWDARRTEVESYESQITEIANLLGVPYELPSSRDGGGTPHRIDLLKQRLQELDVLKVERVGELVIALRAQLVELWDAMFLDLNMRNSYDDEAPSEDLYNKLRDQVASLQQASLEPDRQAIIHEISILQAAEEKEEKLNLMLQDEGRLTKAGFAGRLRQEEMLRKFVGDRKPKAIATLQVLLETWSHSHPFESFYLHGVDITQRLAEEHEKANSRRISISKKRPRPRSANSSVATKRHRPQVGANRTKSSAVTLENEILLTTARSMPALNRPTQVSRPSTVRSAASGKINARAPPANPSLSHPIGSLTNQQAQTASAVATDHTPTGRIAIPPYSRTHVPTQQSTGIIRTIPPVATKRAEPVVEHTSGAPLNTEPIAQSTSHHNFARSKQGPGIALKSHSTNKLYSRTPTNVMSSRINPVYRYKYIPTQQSTRTVFPPGHHTMANSLHSRPSAVSQPSVQHESLRSQNQPKIPIGGSHPVSQVRRLPESRPLKQPLQPLPLNAMTAMDPLETPNRIPKPAGRSPYPAQGDNVENSYFDALHSSYYQQRQSFFDQSHD